MSPLSTNAAPSGDRILRTLVRSASSLPGPTPTVGALVAVSEALSGYLRARGEDPAHLSAGVPVARSGAASGFNHIDTAIVGLHPDARTATSASGTSRDRIGDTAAISVHATSATDVDDYLSRLAAVLGG